MTPDRSTRSRAGRLLRRVAWATVVVVAAWTSTACTITVLPGSGGTVTVSTSRLIETFEPRRGPGASYRVGETIDFLFRSRVDGYVTLSVLEPDGAVKTFARNLAVPGGTTVILDGSSQGVSFRLTPPQGEHRVRASFTPSATDVGRVSFVGRAGESDWTAAIRVDVEPFDTYDVQETSFYLR